MATNLRFEIPSSSQDGSNFVAGYSNGQRSHFVSSSSFERLGSFRENQHESRISTTGPNLPGAGTSAQTELLPLLQVLSLETLSQNDQKYARQVELRKVINAAIGVATDVSSLGAVQAKSLASLGQDELKRVKASLSDNSIRARERAKFLGEAIVKLDKYRFTLSSRKRPRSEISANERSNSSLPGDRSVACGSLLKTGVFPSPSHVDPGTHRADDRNKAPVLNKRLRTSMADVRLEGRPNNANLPRPFGMPDRERDLLKSGSSVFSQAEDKDHALPPGNGGWEKSKMKGRRSGIKSDVSVTTMASGALDGDREHRLCIQHRLSSDSRLRPSEGHGFRSGPVHGIISMHKLESSAQQNGLNVRVMTRNELDGSTFSNEKRDQSIVLEKDRIALKDAGKPGICEESQAASSSIITKGKASRAPRSSSVASTNSSPRVARSSSAFDGWDRPSGRNNVQLTIGSNNRKRPAPTRSPSPPVAQWVGQRTAKMQRVARRMNVVPPAPNQVDSTSLADGVTYRDIVISMGSKPSSSITCGSGVQKRLSNSSSFLQSKSKTGNFSSSTGLSECEGPEGGGENKSKDRSKRNSSVEGKFGPSGQKLGALLLSSKKTKVLSKEDPGNGVRRQGRSGRGLLGGRTSVCPPGDKIDTTSTAKQLRSTRPVPDKVESKTSRPSTKKGAADRKTLTRPRRPVNSGSSDITGESDDDHEELLAAVEAALNASNLACSGPFWKEMEHYFMFLTQDDLDYLKLQIREQEEVELADAIVDLPYCSSQNAKVDLVRNTLPASPSLSFSNRQAYLSGGNVDNDASRLFHGTEGIRTSSVKCIADSWLDKMVPLSQRLLAALIIEDNGEKGTGIRVDGGQDAHFSYMSEASPCGTCSQVDIDLKEADRVEMEVSVEANEGKNIAGHIVSNGHENYLSGIVLHSDEPQEENDILERSEIGLFKAASGNLDGRCTRGGQKNRKELEAGYQATGMVSTISAYDTQYQQMCLDDRILLELHNIGLFPEAVPDMALREDDGIKEELHKLQNELQQQVCKNKAQMYELEKAVFRRREVEESIFRKRERLAMNKLVEIAFNRHVGYRGTNVSDNKVSGTKAAKQAALAFVKRTLDRYQSFEMTGRSCFTDADLKERLFCLVTRETDKGRCDEATEGETVAINVNSGATTGPQDMKPSDISIVDSENAGCLVVHRIHNKVKGGKEHFNTCQADALSLEQIRAKDDSWSIKTKKREVLLEDVVGNGTLKGAPVLGGTKGKRSERDREGKGQNKESITRINNVKGGPQGVSNVKIERKAKTKLRQKTAQLSKAVNGLLGKPTEAPKQSLSIVSDLGEKAVDKVVKVKDEFKIACAPGIAHDLQCDTEGAIDLSHLQLPGMEDLVVNDGLGGQGQDLGSWLNFEDDVLQDAADDFVGLDVPMDDLSDLAMIV